MSAGPATRPLGRTRPKGADFRRLAARLPRAPRIMRGAPRGYQLDLAKFFPRVPWYQLRGFCVGWTGAKNQSAVARIPYTVTAGGTIVPAGPDAAPTATDARSSPLYAYDISRIQAKAEGIDLGGATGPAGDGSIVSCFLHACVTDGWVPWSAYPSDPQYEQPHRNGSVPPAEVVQQGRLRPCKAALFADFDHALEALDGGYPLDLGTDIPQGFLRPDARGWVTLSGPVVGGHSYGLAGYHRAENWGLLSNNWPDWGIPCSDPIWADRFGFTYAADEAAALGGSSNFALVRLDALASYFTPARMRSGASEVGVISGVGGFGGPLLMDYSGFMAP
jgi:hypothetical protein